MNSIHRYHLLNIHEKTLKNSVLLPCQLSLNTERQIFNFVENDLFKKLLPNSQANYSKRRITVVLRIDTLKHLSNESKMQNWYVVERIKSVFSKLALLLRVWQRNFFTKLKRRVKQRNSPFKEKIHNSSYTIFKFKTCHREQRSVSNIKLVFLCI